MASASPCYYYSLIIVTQLLVICVAQEKICPFEYVYQLGDSISDTGHLICVGPIGAFAAARLPYGETIFHRPTCRRSDGLLIIDFFAVALQLPLLNPYLDRNALFDHGANFAVAGSTALDTSFLAAARGIQPLVIDISLSTQLKWFKTLLTSTCPSPAECGLKLRRALIFMGEIGGDDFNYAFSQGKSIQELQDLVPDVVGANITNAVRVSLNCS
ncbi:hypothetical protein RHMOL_Rhmol12G0107300 [Rhododendron molle]|uniref:Uncharacterized protein n=1 Tax=Rhododendron molle TaxID=49168 RepID=A0ACC0LHM5_RHOML|nr:hypothetical protein RHMOL_Rhmol12G0107300 [Rhododendron molle]